MFEPSTARPRPRHPLLALWAWLRHLCLGLLAALALTSGSAAAPPTLLLFGDSLMAGYGLSPAQGFAAQLERALAAAGTPVRIVNASVSGDTTRAGLARLDWSLAERPDAVLLELGANDMLRGLPVAEARANLTAMLDRFAAEEIPVLLAGMKANRSLGADYVEAFDGLYPALAERYGARFYPFFLEGVALDPAFNQADLQHPNAAGVARIVAGILPHVQALLQEVAPRS